MHELVIVDGNDVRAHGVSVVLPCDIRGFVPLWHYFIIDLSGNGNVRQENVLSSFLSHFEPHLRKRKMIFERK